MPLVIGTLRYYEGDATVLKGVTSGLNLSVKVPLNAKDVTPKGIFNAQYEFAQKGTMLTISTFNYLQNIPWSVSKSLVATVCEITGYLPVGGTGAGGPPAPGAP